MLVRGSRSKKHVLVYRTDNIIR